MKTIPQWANNKDNLDFNEEFTRAYDLLENSSKHVFITGKAGTGKSTLLKYFRSNTIKNAAVVAPTGVAAINVQGQTIHSFFGFKPDITPQTVVDLRVSKQKREMFAALNMVIIDEISMVRADLLDCVNKFLRMYGPDPTLNFGGVQMVFFGDMFQLPPIVTYQDRALFAEHYRSPYFFNAHVMEDLGRDGFEGLEFVELKKVYRQTDQDFVDILNAIRDNTVNSEQLAALNARCDPGFESDDDDFYIYLTTTNKQADEINQNHLSGISAIAQTFGGERTGQFDLKSLPTQEELTLKLGAQIMLLNNDPMGRWINGSIGKVLSFHGDETNASIRIELADGKVVNVTPFTWEMFKFSYDAKSGMLVSESVGSFTQLPIRLAWAVTIHKAQGKTFERVIVDVGRGTFAHGQMYVALTRCTSLDGLILSKPISKRDIIVDRNIVAFSKFHKMVQAKGRFE